MVHDQRFRHTRGALLRKLRTSNTGLTSREAAKRLKEFGYNQPATKHLTVLSHLLSKFLSPLVLILAVIAVISWALGQQLSAIFVGSMILMSVLLSFIQEYRSNKAAERLKEMVRTTAAVIRDGVQKEIDIKDIVPGDLVVLNAGDIVPADIQLVATRDLFVNQSSLTGESLPIEKFAESDASVFMGSSVVSGSGTGFVLKTGCQTHFGEISQRLNNSTVSSFEAGITSFTWLMIRIIIVLASVIFIINLSVKGNIVEAVLFSLAVAVGLTPEMLPMLVTINLSQGAILMAKKKVIVKKLNSIQDFGAMDILCTDKTGTLTENRIVLEKYCDLDGHDDMDVLHLAYVNSTFESGVKNLLDKAILAHKEIGPVPYKKVDEIPFDFSRRIMSVVVNIKGKPRLIAKGAPEEIFKRCTHYELHGKIHAMPKRRLDLLEEEFRKLSAEGLMVLAVAYKDIPQPKKAYSTADEAGLTLRGYVAFLDPPKVSTAKTIKALNALGVQIKVVTGDNELVTKKICEEVGIKTTSILTGKDVEKLNAQQLRKVVDETTIFARLNPLQKERVITALRQNGHVVGYLGDGINDAPSLKAADVGISVNNAVDIAKETADIILLEKDLSVLRDGVLEGRRVFGNITKYIRMGASSNFGNMFSMTVGSFLPFLPMAPVQILLNNFLYDVSQMAVPSDTVDKEFLVKPRPWDLGGIKRFIYFIGPLSSIFDIITFAVMWFVFHAPAALFQTGWFVESLCTQTLIVHVIRTNKIPFIESKPSSFLMFMTLAIVVVGIALPFTPLAPTLGLVPPPVLFWPVLALIVLSYLVLVHRVKAFFIKRYGLE